MTESPERESDQDPEPIKHSDAERVSGEQAANQPREGEEEEDSSDDGG